MDVLNFLALFSVIITIGLIIIYLGYKSYRQHKVLYIAEQISRHNHHIFKKEVLVLKSLSRDPNMMKKNLLILFDNLVMIKNEIKQCKKAETVDEVSQRMTVLKKMNTIRRIITSFIFDIYVYYLNKYCSDKSMINLQKFKKYFEDFVDYEYDYTKAHKEYRIEKIKKAIIYFVELTIDICENLRENLLDNTEYRKLLKEDEEKCCKLKNMAENLKIEKELHREDYVVNDVVNEYDNLVMIILLDMNKIELDI